MKVEVKIPTVGESITEATIGEWVKKDGEYVQQNDIIMLLETDKASVEITAEAAGTLKIQAQAGEVVKMGATVATIDTDAKATAGTPPPAPPDATPKAPPSNPSANHVAAQGKGQLDAGAGATRGNAQPLSPAAQRLVGENNINVDNVTGTGKDGRITKGDLLQSLEGSSSTVPTARPSAAQPTKAPPPVAPPTAAPPTPRQTRAQQSPEERVRLVPMTTIRKRIAERLLQAQENAAILTTFNEIDMTRLFALRTKYKEKFKEKHGVNLGMMGIFAKASMEALKEVPAVNAWITGNDLEYHNYCNLGIAVSTEKGLMVPVIKDADQMSIAEIELAIRGFALKARDGKITVDDLSGGTFSITNGGVFGSLLSTPILNPPQSAILGMHKVEDRAVVINGKVEARPMMYVALSYDHRVIDGKEAVTFLVKIKEGVEDPERLLLEI